MLGRSSTRFQKIGKSEPVGQEPFSRAGPSLMILGQKWARPPSVSGRVRATGHGRFEKRLVLPPFHTSPGAQKEEPPWSAPRTGTRP